VGWVGGEVTTSKCRAGAGRNDARFACHPHARAISPLPPSHALGRPARERKGHQEQRYRQPHRCHLLVPPPHEVVLVGRVVHQQRDTIKDAPSQPIRRHDRWHQTAGAGRASCCHWRWLLTAAAASTAAAPHPPARRGRRGCRTHGEDGGGVARTARTEGVSHARRHYPSRAVEEAGGGGSSPTATAPGRLRPPVPHGAR